MKLLLRSGVLEARDDMKRRLAIVKAPHEYGRQRVPRKDQKETLNSKNGNQIWVHSDDGLNCSFIHVQLPPAGKQWLKPIHW